MASVDGIRRYFPLTICALARGQRRLQDPPVFGRGIEDWYGSVGDRPCCARSARISMPNLPALLEGLAGAVGNRTRGGLEEGLSAKCDDVLGKSPVLVK